MNQIKNLQIVETNDQNDRTNTELPNNLLAIQVQSEINR